ncbi:MAG: hypothetical protein MUD16_02270 [Desulfobacterales bacterium]|jgi:hypothetical protein|nr:hypothetical protein [Desulfobacterales bacterium]
MQITTYQMHNVLECFCRRLSKNREPEKAHGGPARSAPDPTAAAPEISRRAAMDKISEQVLHTIAQAADEAGESPGGKTPPPVESSFTFNIIDAINRKQTATLAAGDAGALIKRLGQMAENRRGRTSESWG